MDLYLAYKQLQAELGVVNILLGLIFVMTALRVYLSVRTNRWLRSIDKSLKMLQGAAREIRRVA